MSDVRTYKCGHCGKTLPDSSEFHRHSALSHGDKIPDLVKDPEVSQPAHPDVSNNLAPRV